MLAIETLSNSALRVGGCSVVGNRGRFKCEVKTKIHLLREISLPPLCHVLCDSKAKEVRQVRQFAKFF